MPHDIEPDPDFDALLEFLRESHGVDFAGYKRPSLQRLVGRRMVTAGASDLRSYLDLLQVNPGEVRALFDGLLINVTAFFRDGTPWETLRRTLLPELLDSLRPTEPIRVWSAACATGEEAYSLAILLHEALGDEAYRRRVKIYATDVDEGALAVARSARYPQRAVEALPDDVVKGYFVDEGTTLAFRPDLRSTVIFGRHDLLADAPISRVGLLSCRNVLMYFTAETQAQVLERFAFALHDDGLMFLGKAEMMLSHGDLFRPASLPDRIFRVNRRPGRVHHAAFGLTGGPVDAPAHRVVEAAFEAGPEAQVVLDGDQRVALVNEAACRHLGVQQDDVGRAFEQLELSYRPLELRSLVEGVLESGRPAEVRNVRWGGRGQPETWWDVQVAALPSAEDRPLGVRISFTDVTRYHQLTSDLSQAHVELQEAYEELQSSSEELETTNEELQSAIEELETTNEELQSTNEELETMNEELQSTNEELQTVNDELRERTTEIGEINALLEGILAGLRAGVAVVDRDLRVLVWNVRAERMWGLRGFEVEGVPVLGLHGGLPVDTLRRLTDLVLMQGADDVTEEVSRINRFGEQVVTAFTANPLRDRSGEVRGVVLAMVEHRADQPG